MKKTKVSSDLIWYRKFLQNSQSKLHPKNSAEDTLLIDEKTISQEASYTLKQNSRKINSPKTCINENIFAW